MTTQTIKFSDIDIAPARDARAEIREQLVYEYGYELKVNRDLGPGLVFFDGLTNWLGDGLHRLTAGTRVGRDAGEFEIRQGGYDEAFEFACRANDNHGGRTSNDDKRARCETYWRRHAHDDPRPSDRKVALATNVSHTLANEVRRALEEAGDVAFAANSIDSLGRTQPGTKPRDVAAADTSPENTGVRDQNEPLAWPDRPSEPDPEEVPGPHRDADSLYNGDPDDAEEITAKDWEEDAPREPTLGDEQRAFTTFSAKLGKLNSELETFANGSATRREWIDHNRKEEFRVRVSNLQEVLRAARPEALCGYCGGEKCKQCRGTGMLPHALATVAPNAEVAKS